MNNLSIPVIVLLFIFGFFGLDYLITPYKCSSYQEMTGKETKYSWPICYVKNNGEWLTMKQYDSTLKAVKIETK